MLTQEGNLAQLRAALEELRSKILRPVDAGQCVDFAQYKGATGRAQGIQDAIEEIDRTLSAANKPDESKGLKKQ